MMLRPIRELVEEALTRLTAEQLSHLASERRRREVDPEAGAWASYAADIAAQADPATSAVFMVPAVVDAWRALGIDDDIISRILFERLEALGIAESEITGCLYRVTGWLPPHRRLERAA